MVNQLPDPEMLVTHYNAPSPPRPGRPRVRLARRGSQLLISWSRTADTSATVVAVNATNGLRTAYRLRGRELAIPDFATAGAVVRVTAVDSAGRPGPATTVRLAKTGAPGPVSGLTLRLAGARLIVGWRAVPGAITYRVRLMIGGSRPVLLATGRRLLILKPRNVKSAAFVSVAAEAPDGTVGRAASARLARHK
jgi:hypothetical protein